MEWIRSWSEGIVISIIIATLVEMLLPNNSSKKYIKIIVGVFVVYNIIYPVLSMFTSVDVEQTLKVNDILQTSTSMEYEYNSINQNAVNSVRGIYKQNLENSIRTGLKSEGYEAGNLSVKISNDDNYNIEKIDLEITNKEQNVQEEKQVYSIVDTIKHVTISVSNEAVENNSVINDRDKDLIKKYLNETYGVSSEKINVY